MLAAAGPRPHHLSSERAICSLAEANMVLNDWSLLKAEAAEAVSDAGVGSWVSSRVTEKDRGGVWRRGGGSGGGAALQRRCGACGACGAAVRRCGGAAVRWCGGVVVWWWCGAVRCGGGAMRGCGAAMRWCVVVRCGAARLPPRRRSRPTSSPPD
eukprot:scaffold37429_cov60-Phaeocystis_antarctica.AAC.2